MHIKLPCLVTMKISKLGLNSWAYLFADGQGAADHAWCVASVLNRLLLQTDLCLDPTCIICVTWEIGLTMCKRSWAQHTFPNFLISGTRSMFHSINVKILRYPPIPVYVAATWKLLWEDKPSLRTNMLSRFSRVWLFVTPWTVTH